MTTLIVPAVLTLLVGLVHTWATGAWRKPGHRMQHLLELADKLEKVPDSDPERRALQQAALDEVYLAIDVGSPTARVVDFLVSVFGWVVGAAIVTAVSLRSLSAMKEPAEALAGTLRAIAGDGLNFPPALEGQVQQYLAWAMAAVVGLVLFSLAQGALAWAGAWARREYRLNMRHEGVVGETD